MTVAADIMMRHPIRIPASSTIGDVAQLMSHLVMRHVLIVDDAGQLVGIVSDRDVRGPLPRRGRAPVKLDPGRGIRAVMTPNPVNATPDADLSTLARLMTEHSVSALLIVDATGAMVGIVSYVDVLRRLADEADDDDVLALMDRDELVAHPPPK